MSKPPPKKGSGGAGSANPLNPLKPQGANPAIPGQPATAGTPGAKPPPKGAPVAAKPVPAAPPATANPTKPAGPAAPAATGTAAAPRPAPAAAVAPAAAPAASPAGAPGAAVKAPPKGAPKTVPQAAPGAAKPGGARPAAASSDKIKVGSGKVTLSSGGGKPGAGAGLMAQHKAATAAAKDRAGGENLEDRVLDLPGFAQIQVPKVFEEYVEQLVPRLDLAATSRELLRAFSNIDVTAEKVSQVLKQNPYYENQFYRVIESMGRKREDVPRLEGAVIMLGMQNSRNLILALQALRTVRRSHPEWDKNGKLRVSPTDVLKYALKCEEMLGGSKGTYVDTAYAAGLVFDLLSLSSQEVLQDNQDKKRVASYIDGLFMHGLKTAQVAGEIAKVTSDYGFKKFLFSACLLHDVGKAAMAIANPSYLDFLEDCSKREVPRAVRLFAEARRFGTTHAALGGLICNYTRMFRPIEKVVLYHHEPYLIARGERNIFQVTQLVCLATNVANNYKRTDRQDDPIIAFWKGPELAGFRIDNKSLIQAVARAG